jgi:cytoplasmic tRNA 2-thiolation protein 1
MNESIRTEIRNFLNQLEETRPGIKYNIYNSVLKISAGLKSQISHKGSTKCLVCQRQSTNKICSVCKTVAMLSGQSSKK